MLRNLKTWQQVAIAAAVTILPAAPLLSFFVTTQLEEVAGVRAALSGLDQLRPSRKLLEQLAANRDTSGLPALEKQITQMRQFGEQANLTLDRQPDTHHLAVSLVAPLPDTLEAAVRLRAAGRTKPAPEELAEISQLAKQLNASAQRLDHNVRAAFRHNPSLEPRLDRAVSSAVNAALQFSARAQSGVADSSFLESGTTAIDRALALSESIDKILSGLLNARLDQATGNMTSKVSFAFAVWLAAIAVLYFTLNKTSRQIDNIDGGLLQSHEEKERIQKAVNKLLHEVSGVAQGDLTQQAEVTGDVTGAIADSFNHMIGELREIIRSVQKTSREVDHSARHVAATAEVLAQGSEEQNRQIVETASAITTMAASIQQVSETAKRATTVAEQALADAREGASTVRRTVEGMDSIRGQVQETSKRIKRLGESSQEIGEIVELIGDIADRTSILALNASIQAAMAGEAGRGFAVVAQEVERLADRATEATKRIALLIKSVQSDTHEAITAMEETTREVVGGSGLANEAGSRLQGIESVSTQIAELVKTISLEAQQQVAGSAIVSRNVAGISVVTEETASGARLAAESIQRLTLLASDLNKSVTRFTLPAEGPDSPRA